jgi:NAD(P)-dependent dehydrogenase (short-subunit alcohol dehydrogenase family)
MTRTETLWSAAALGIAGAVLRKGIRMRRAISFAGKSVLIVGGSRGLGLVLARRLAAEGARLALVARDADELLRAQEDLAERGAKALVIPCDARDRTQIEQAVATTVAEYGGLDVLINNAGVIQVGPLAHMTIEDFQNAMATHFWGPLYAILAAMPHMRQGGAKRIVNISSIGGKIGVPHLVPYSASKFALAGLTQGLRAELAADGIIVTGVYPGLMRTGSTYNATFKGQNRQEFAWFHTADSLPGLSVGADRAARQILDACRHGDAELRISLPAKLAPIVNAIVPGTMAAAMRLTNQLLPAPDPAAGTRSRSGWQSVSDAVPTSLTRLGERASLANNEVPQT